MRYLLLIYGDEKAWDADDPDAMAQMMQEYDGFTKWLDASGGLVAAEALEPTNQATTVRVRDDQTITTDGPFAETKEQLGGFYLIEAANLDDAIGAASRIPGAKGGSIEIRPIVVTPGDGSHEAHEG
jgi:hypothetical protein